MRNIFLLIIFLFTSWLNTEAQVVSFSASSPTINCGDNSVTVDIITDDFTDITSVTYSVEWDETVLTFNSVTNFNTSIGVNSNNFNTSSEVDNGAIGFVWFSGSNQTLPPGSRLFSITFIPTGTGTSSFINFTDGPPTPINVSGDEGVNIPNPGFNSGTVTLTDTNDTEDPVLSDCPSDVMVTAAPGASSATANWIPPTATDNCFVVLSSTHNPGDNFPIGTTTVTYTATDGNNNSVSCPSFDVIVEESDQPSGDLTFSISSPFVQCDDNAIFVDVTVDNFIDITSANFTIEWDETILQYVGLSNQSALGLNGNNFNDMTAANGALGFSWFSGSNTDLNDGTTIFSIEFSLVGNTNFASINFTNGPPTTIGATADNGNTAVTPDLNNGGVTILNTSDNEDPEISNCPDNITQQIPQGATEGPVNWIEPTADDNCFVTLSSTHNPGDNFPLGTTTVTYTATDGNNNTDICSFDVTIENETAPDVVSFTASSATIPCGGNAVIDITVADFFNMTSVGFSIGWDETVLDFIQITNLNTTLGLNGNNFNQTPATVDMGGLGFSWFSGTNTTLADTDILFSIEFTATGMGANSSIIFTNTPTTIGATQNNGNDQVTPNFNAGVVNINENDDTIDPVISNCPDDITVLIPSGASSSDVDWMAPNANDNCNLVDFDGTHDPGDNFLLGTTTVTYTATDGQGNTSQCMFDVTVENNGNNNTLTFNAGSEIALCGQTTVSINITVENFIDITSSSFSVGWDETVLGFVQVSNANTALGLNSNNFNTEPQWVNNGSLGFSWFTFSGENLPDDAILFTIDFTILTESSSAISFLNNQPTPIGATSNNGNTQITPIVNSGMFTFNNTDTVDPIITNCPDNITDDTADGTCEQTATWTIPMVSDACDANPTLSSTHNPGDTFPEGTTTVTYTATDASNNTTTCSFTVTINDNQAPMITCPATATIQCGDSREPANTNGMATATDNCNATPIIDFTDDDSNLNECGFGFIVRTWTADDGNGGVSPCPQTIVVSGTIEAVCQNVEVTLVNGTATLNPELVNNGSTGGCGDLSFALDQTDFDCSNLGPNTVTLTVTDECDSNTPSTCEATVTVTAGNGGGLTVTCPDMEVSIDCNDSTDPSATGMPTATDNCSGDEITPTFEDDVSGFDATCRLGIIVRTWTITNGTDTETCTQNINVTAEAFEANCQDITIQVDDSGATMITSSQINDNTTGGCGELSFSIDRTSFNCSDIGNMNIVTLTATDACDANNTATCTSTVTVEMTDEITINCPAATTVDCNGNIAPIATGGIATATDACGNSISVDFVDDPVNGGSCPGTITRVWTATGPNGNTMSCTQMITIQAIAIQANCQNITITLDDNGMASIIGEQINSNSSGGCGMLSYSVSPNEFNTSDLGENDVILTVTDECGGSAMCPAVVTIQNPTGNEPDITCPEIAPVSTDLDVCSATIANVDLVIETPANGIESVTFIYTGATSLDNGEGTNAGGTFNEGTTTVIFTVTGTNGEVSMCPTTITVNDRQLPVLTCPDNVEVECNGSISPNETGMATASDNCGAEVPSFLDDSVDQCPGSVITRTWDVLDVNGNQAVSCTQTITIAAQAVDANCQDITVTLDDNGMASITGVQVNLNSTGCGDLLYSVSPSDFETSDIGPNDVILTVTDDCNQMGTCMAIVTVQNPMGNEPDITCPEIAPVSTDLDLCSAAIANVDIGINTPADEIESVTFIYTGATSLDNGEGTNAGGTFNAGTTTVTFTVTGTNGEVSMCPTTITVNDRQLPVLTCPDNVEVDCNGSISSNETGMATASDNCGAEVPSFLDDSVDQCPGSVITRTWDVLDVNGNQAVSCTQTITIAAQAVDANCQDITVTLDDNGMASITGIQVNLNSTGCGDLLYSVSPSDFETSDIGPNDVILTVTDDCNQMGTCMAIVTVQNPTGNEPDITCPEIAPVSTDLDLCSAAIANVDIGINTPAEEIESVTFTYTGATSLDNGEGTNAGGIFNAGTTTVTFTVTGTNGEVSMCPTTITVNDRQLPVLTCPDNVEVDCNGSISSNETGMATASDNCGAEVPSFLDDSVDQCPGSVITRTWDVLDVNGNQAVSCTQTITITAEPIEVTCQNTIVTLNNEGMASITRDDIHLNSSGGCGMLIYELSQNEFDNTHIGDNNVTLTVTDACGDSLKMCTAVVTVQDPNDGTPPDITCPSAVSVSTDLDACSAEVTGLVLEIRSPQNEVAEVAFIYEGATQGSGEGTDASGTFNIGETTVTFTATGTNGQARECRFIVNVNDTQAPFFETCPNDMSFNLQAGSCDTILTWTEPIITENCTIDTIIQSHESGDMFSIGTTNVVYIALDEAGNADTCSFDVTITEPVDPTIECPEDIVVSNDIDACNAAVTWAVPEGMDNCGEVVVSNSHNPDDTFPVGTTTVTHTATDLSGNTASCTFDITVNDDQAPAFSNCPSDIMVTVINEGACDTTINWIIPGASDNCPETLIITTSHQPNSTFPIGTTMVEYVATDGNNTATCRFNVNVEGNSIATDFCPENITQPSAVGECQSVVIWDIPMFSSDCSSLSVEPTHNPGDIFPVGTTTVEYVATDTFGNMNTCSFDVIILDNEMPVVSDCPADTTINVGAENCSVNYSWIVPSVTDNCGIQETTNTHQPGDTFEIGETDVTYTYVDLNGNVTFCRFTVNVVDNNGPVIDCPEPVEVRIDGTIISDPSMMISNAISDNCNTVSLEFDTPTAMDACSSSTIEQTDTTGLMSGSIFPTGLTTLEYTATDTFNNVSICEVDITIVSFASVEVDVTNSEPCETEFVKFSAPELEGATYTWEGPDGTTYDGPSLSIEMVGLEDSGLWTITIVDENGCTSFGTFTITVYRTPDVVASASSTLFCGVGDENLQLMAEDNANAEVTTWCWQTPNRGEICEQNPLISNLASDDSGLYIVTGTTEQGCLSSDTIEVNVLGVNGPILPTLIATPNNICLEDAVALTGTSYAGTSIEYHWVAEPSEGSGLTDVNANVLLVTPTVAGDYTYKYWVTDGGCSTDTASVMVHVEQPAPITIDVEGETECVDGTTSITLTGATDPVIANTSAITCTWTHPDGSTANPGSVLVLDNVTSAQTGNYTVTCTTANGCMSTNTVFLDITDLTEMPMLSIENEVVCEGESFEINVLTEYDPTANYSWTAEPMEGSGLPGVVTTTSLSVTPDMPGTYVYSLMVSIDGCVSNAGSITGVSSTTPTPDLAAMNTMLDCIPTGSSLTLVESSGTGMSWSWTTPRGEFTGNNIELDNITKEDAGTYAVMVTSADGCSATESIIISITGALAQPNLKGPDALCEGEDISGDMLCVTNPIEGATYTWMGPGGVLNATGPCLIINNVTSFNAGEYTAISNLEGCSSVSSEAFILDVLDAPDLGDDEILSFVGLSTVFDATTNDDFNKDVPFTVKLISNVFKGELINEGDGSFTYTPDPGEFKVDNFVYEICYDDCADNCDMATVSIEITFPNDECKPTTVLSPNGDGKNDLFFITCVEAGEFPNNSLTIYNRWGDQVYDAAPYNNDWGGTYKNETLPDGTYYFIFKREPNDPNPIKSFITIYK